MAQPLFRQIAIVGLGLIGGSLGMALRKGRVARRVIGFSRHESTVRQAKARGAIDDGDTKLCPEWLGKSDLVIIATPPLSVVPVARETARITRGRFILTDVTSTKGVVISKLERLLPSRISVIGGHPMAGKECSGIRAAKADFFQGAACVVTKTPRTHPSALSKVSSLWRAVGGRVVVLSPKEHDRLVAQVSHLPHLAAVALTLTVQDKALPLAAGGFKDATRIALSDPELWSEIAKTNSKEITHSLDRFLATIQRLRGRIHSGNFSALRKELSAAQRKHRRVKR